MLGSVEQGERGSFAGAVERSAGRQLRAPFDVTGRQRAQGAGHFGSSEIGKVPLLQRSEPLINGQSDDVNGL